MHDNARGVDRGTEGRTEFSAEPIFQPVDQGIGGRVRGRSVRGLAGDPGADLVEDGPAGRGDGLVPVLPDQGLGGLFSEKGVEGGDLPET
jgi:hypothetical protein